MHIALAHTLYTTLSFALVFCLHLQSVSAFYGTYCLTDYCASKAASHRLQDALASELKYSGYDGIRFSSILPYFMNTGMFAGSNSKVIDILEPDYVANECMEAILLNKAVVFLPKIFHVFRALTMMIPIKAYFAFHRSVFGGDMMKNFTGRHGQKQQTSSMPVITDISRVNNNADENDVKKRLNGHY